MPWRKCKTCFRFTQTVASGERCATCSQGLAGLDPESPAACVRRGALLLDGINPAWFAALVGKQIDLAEPDACPLGRLYGRYWLGRNAMKNFVPGFCPVWYGFQDPDNLNDTQEMNVLWHAEVQARRRRQPSLRTPPLPLTAAV